MKAPVFVTARWRALVMVNYQVEAAALAPLVPRGVELDLWQGRALASLVGFLFLETKVMGVGVPFHRRFEEVNLRFYVHRDAEGAKRRGVVFVKELVPKTMIAAVARLVYGERYVAVPMRSAVDLREGATVAYEWRHRGRWDRLSVRAGAQGQLPEAGSEAEFITEHYWGYSRRRDGPTWEYEVEHPRWEVRPVSAVDVSCRFGELYGPVGDALSPVPRSAFLAEGSQVVVRRGTRLPDR